MESLVTTGMSGEEAEREPWHEDRQDLCTASAILLSGESETNGEHDLFQVPIISSLGKALQSTYLPSSLSSLSAVHGLTECHGFEKITNITMFQSRRNKYIFNQVCGSQVFCQRSIGWVGLGVTTGCEPKTLSIIILKIFALAPNLVFVDNCNHFNYALIKLCKHGAL